ncbi:response regulator [Spongiimicrobium sp. 2-473A-2-J]|uniref:response regulator n=1 Tax=Eudoraea algarum TaxID=3417568 RepID=UPI003D36FCE1
MLLFNRYFYGLLFVGVFLQAQQRPTMSFSEIKNGLNNKWISCIAQDRTGFIWVGTQDGLHRYDGYHFEVFRNSPEAPESLAANWIRAIVTDVNHNFWIGTHGGGLTKFSPRTMDFRNFAIDEPNESTGKIISHTVLAGKNHMVSSTEEGFQLYDINTNSRRNLGLGYFKSPITASENLLWLAENQVLYTQNFKSSNIRLVHTFESDINLLEYIPGMGLVIGLKNELILFNKGRIEKQIPMAESVVNMTLSANGDYFLASASSLFKFDPNLFRLQKIDIDVDMTKRSIETIFVDRQSNLWMGTNKGLYKEKKYNKAFLRDNINLHARRIVKHKGSLYLGGGNGLFKVEGPNIRPLITDRGITALFDGGDALVASSTMEEIYKFVDDRPYGTFEISNTFNKKLVVYGLTKDHKDRLWVGSWRGLHIIDEQGQPLRFISLNTESQNGEAKIINVHVDSKDRLWVITAGYGIYMLEDISNLDPDTANLKIVNYRSVKEDSNSITSNIVLTMEEDEKGQMWFGTEYGLVRYREEGRNFHRLEFQDRVFDKKVMSLQIDANQNLWITTIGDGIYVYNEEIKAFRHFTTNDGLISNAFLFGSGFYDETRELMYFGTDEGVQLLDLSRPFAPKKRFTPVITAIHANGKKTGEFIAPSQAPFLSELSLAHFQNDFSLRFSAMDFIAPEKIRYAYSLDAGDWRMTDLQTAYFTNMAYGNHVLKVKALYDGKAHNNQIKSFKILIAPPWYLSTLAKILYALLLCTIGIGIYLYFKWRWTMKLSLQLTEEEAQRLKKLNAFKSNLYTEIAHEFKTPLTLISGPIDSSLSEGNLTDINKANFSIVQRNTRRLTSLVDQLLELAKLEDGKLNLKITQGDLGLFLQTVSQSFRFQAQSKDIAYTTDIGNLDQVWYDEDIIEKVVSNLLSNAFKYTPRNGMCFFSANKYADYVVFSVKNTALNAANLPLEKLFNRFYQHDTYAEGMGVGLSLVKEIVKVYGGTIKVALEQNELLHFRLELPVKREAFPDASITRPSRSPKTAENLSEVIHIGNHCPTSGPKEALPLLLVVEDHGEIRTFIRLALQKHYRILEAENGEEGMELAISAVPDIILSDIRMPVRNGIELCNAVKNDERTGHIPIILLTASVGEEFELKGLSSGADDYITKPFKITVLRQRIANLIAIRRKLRRQYSQEFVLKPKDITVTPGDEAFLNRVQQVLDENLADPEFNAEAFSKKVNMSRMQLHRKLLAYTGLSTSAFIRSQRLSQAVQLLNSSDLTISEVAYTVGFNTPRYFMKCFKETFKKTPSQYLQSTVCQ